MEYILGPMLEGNLGERQKQNKDSGSVHNKASGPVIKSTEDVL